MPDVWTGLWRVLRCELVVGDPVWSIRGCLGSLLCHFSAPKRNTHAHVQPPKPGGLNIMPAFAFVTAEQRDFQGLAVNMLS